MCLKLNKLKQNKLMSGMGKSLEVIPFILGLAES